MGGILGLSADWLLLQYYWQPYTLLGRGVVSVEPFLCGFCAVALVAVCYLFISGRRDKIVKLYQQPKFLIRLIVNYFMMLAIGCCIIYFLMYICKLDVWISISSVFFILVLFVMLRLKKWELIRIYISHALIVTGIMLMIGLVSYFLWWLAFPSYWPDVLILNASWNVTILGFMPLSELIYWTLILGAVELELGEQPGKKITKKKKAKESPKKC
jgi:hypothetical protein